MRMLDAGRARLTAVWIAATMASCSEPQCPHGYRKEHDTCYRIKDAGDDAQASEDGDGPDSGSDDAESERFDGDVESRHDAGAKSEDADFRDSQYSDSGVVPICTPKCAEHEVCKAENGGDVCACASGYSTCGQACKDLMADPLNCGACGYACAEGLACKQGQCDQQIRELVLDSNVSCVLYDSPDGNFPVKCWGDGSSGLFRDGVTEALKPRSVVGVTRVRALALLGSTYCMVVPGEDKIRCWGGEGASASAFLPDVALGGVTRVTGAGADASDGWGTSLCALHGAGDVSCWGAARVNGAGEDRAHPQGTINIQNNGIFTQVEGGYVHACAIAADGRVGCWGAVGWTAVPDSTLGVPNDTFTMGATWSSGVFVQKEQGGSLAGVVKIGVGSTTCAVTKNGELWCWGPNAGGWRTTPGILGVGDEMDHAGAVKVALQDVTEVALGWGAQACAIVQGGQVYCWGTVDLAGLGPGVVSDSATKWALTKPQAVPGLSDAVEIEAGAGHTCARRRNGAVLCWGQNGFGEVGDGTKIQRLSPTPVVGLYD